MPKKSSDWQRARSPDQIEARKRSILRSARKLLDRDGMEGTGINAIAREVGLSKPNLYRYFETREAILLEILLEEHDEWIDHFLANLKELPEPATPESIADAFVSSVEERERYCILIGAVATVLEHNVSYDTVFYFKTGMASRNRRCLEAFCEAVPAIDPSEARPILTTLVMSSAGIWPHCHPAPVVREVIQNPEFERMRYDFSFLVRNCAVALVRNALEGTKRQTLVRIDE
ncbi:MAG: TetR family transcriptional regulator [Verrucomicrobiota bacterium]